MLHTLSGSGNVTVNKIVQKKKSQSYGIYIPKGGKENKPVEVLQYRIVEMLKVLKRKIKQDKEIKTY